MIAIHQSTTLRLLLSTVATAAVAVFGGIAAGNAVDDADAPAVDVQAGGGTWSG